VIFLAREKDGSRPRAYVQFANLCREPPEKATEFIKTHGPLGLDPWDDGPTWHFQGRFFSSPGEALPGAHLLKGRKPGPSEKQQGIENVFFSPWGNKPPQRADSVPEITETAGVVLAESWRMFHVIQLWRVLEECSDKRGFLVRDKIIKRKAEIERSVGTLICQFPASFDVIYVDFASNQAPEQERVYRGIAYGSLCKSTKTVIMLPDFRKFFNDILARVRFRIAPKSGVGYQYSDVLGFEGLEIDEGCLLARLWYELVSDLIRKKAAPRFCKWCNKLFYPTDPRQEYCDRWEYEDVPNCQESAKQHRARLKKATEEGRTLRPGPGRPPGKNPQRAAE